MTSEEKPLVVLHLGATGEFPDGKLSPDDDGELAMAVCAMGNIVRLDFGKPVIWIGFDPPMARHLAGLLLEAAEAIAVQLKEANPS